MQLFSHLRFPTKQQNAIWLKRRQHVPPSDIAEGLGVSRPFISKAQRIAEARIAQLISYAAAINRIRITRLDSRSGFAIGFCPSTEDLAYVVYSPTLGVHTWFAHQGNCASCESAESCHRMLEQLSKGWKIPIDESLPPTKGTLTLFHRLQEELGWSTTG